MPQLDKFTYFTQFFWSCLFLFLLSIFFHYFFPSFRYTSASLLLLSNKAQVTAGSFYYEMVHLFLFTTSLSIYHFRFGWVKSRPIFIETLFYHGLRGLLKIFGFYIPGLLIVQIASLLCYTSLPMEDPAGGNMDSSGGSHSISVGGESTMGGGSSRGSGWTSFDLDVLAEPTANENERGEEVAQPNPPNALPNPVASPGEAQEALPQAPAQAEGAQPPPTPIKKMK